MRRRGDSHMPVIPRRLSGGEKGRVADQFAETTGRHCSYAARARGCRPIWDTSARIRARVGAPIRARECAHQQLVATDVAHAPAPPCHAEPQAKHLLRGSETKAMQPGHYHVAVGSSG